MRTVLIAVFGGVLMSGCGGSPEERFLDLMGDIAEEIEDVTDAASAQAAAKNIESLGEDLKAIASEMQTKAATPSKELAEKMMTAAMRIGTAMQRLQEKDPAAFRALADAVSKAKVNP